MTYADAIASLPVRASLALAMRAAQVPKRTVCRVAGEDADLLAAEVEGWTLALSHLNAVGLAGTEPPEITAVRRMARRWVT